MPDDLLAHLGIRAARGGHKSYAFEVGRELLGVIALPALRSAEHKRNLFLGPLRFGRHRHSRPGGKSCDGALGQL